MHIQNMREVLKSYALYTLVLTVVVATLTCAMSAYAVLYPNWGFYKMSMAKTVDRGQIGMSSTRPYDADIIAAYAKVKNSTTGYSEMPSSIWPNGYNMVQNNWTGTWNYYVDIMIQWTDRTGDSVGITNSNLRPSAFCVWWGQPSNQNCGVFSTISLDITRWANYGPGNLRQRVVMHETGHAVGMNDYCGSDAIMNNGAGYCNGGKWTALMNYTAYDRSTLNSVYR